MPLPFVISLPHCSSRVPEAFLPAMALSPTEIIESEDIGTAEIFGQLPAEGIIEAHWSRLVVDLNRSPKHEGPKGVLASVDYHGRPIFRPGKKPDAAEVKHRIARYHRPFHRRIQRALNNPAVAGLFDCHSLREIGPPEAPDAGRRRKDIIIGDGSDLSAGRPPCCPEATLQIICRCFAEAGFSVGVNDPYAGGFITVHYGTKLSAQDRFALQVEINQGLFADEGELRPDETRLRVVAQRIGGVFQEMARRLK
jgi:N-formylglutamate deformylase